MGFWLLWIRCHLFWSCQSRSSWNIVTAETNQKSPEARLTSNPEDNFTKYIYPGNARLRKVNASTYASKTHRSPDPARQRISKRGWLRQAWEPMCSTFHHLFMVEIRKNYHSQPCSWGRKLQLTDFSKEKTMCRTSFPFPQFGLTRLG